MAPPAFRAEEFRIHPDQDAAYATLEQAALEGRKPQQGNLEGLPGGSFDAEPRPLVG